MRDKEMNFIADKIDEAILQRGSPEKLAQIRKDVAALCAHFPIYEKGLFATI
jgi:glycine/serine hydroxymethyltransferase